MIRTINDLYIFIRIEETKYLNIVLLILVISFIQQRFSSIKKLLDIPYGTVLKVVF